MRRTYLLPLARSALASLVVALALLGLPGTSLADSPSRDGALAQSGLLQRGAGYGQPREAVAVRALQRRLRSSPGVPARWTGSTARGPKPLSPASSRRPALPPTAS